MTAPGAHRRGRHRPSLPPWWPAVALAAFGAVLVFGAVLTGGRPAIEPPAPALASAPVTAPVTVPIPVPETVPSMVVYDDDPERGRERGCLGRTAIARTRTAPDPERGRERCEFWQSLYVPDTTACAVRPTADGPSPARARAGQDWWTEHYPESEETS